MHTINGEFEIRPADDIQVGKLANCLDVGGLEVNFFDLCAISLPLPRDGGLSTGLMLVGRNGSDAKLFAIAAAVEKLLAG